MINSGELQARLFIKGMGWLKSGSVRLYVLICGILAIVWKIHVWASQVTSGLIDSFVEVISRVGQHKEWIEGASGGVSVAVNMEYIRLINAIFPCWEVLCMMVLLLNFMVLAIYVRAIIRIYQMIPLKSC